MNKSMYECPVVDMLRGRGDADGNLYDVQTGRCEGTMLRDAAEHLRGLQGADSTDNAPDLGVCAYNTDTE